MEVGLGGAIGCLIALPANGMTVAAVGTTSLAIEMALAILMGIASGRSPLPRRSAFAYLSIARCLGPAAFGLVGQRDSLITSRGRSAPKPDHSRVQTVHHGRYCARIEHQHQNGGVFLLRRAERRRADQSS